MLETITTHFNFDALDYAIREQLLHFFNDFSGASARTHRYAAARKKNLQKKSLNCVKTASTTRQIGAYLSDEYGIEIFPADVLSFLEDSVHVLEAISDVAHLSGEDVLAAKTVEHIRLIER